MKIYVGCAIGGFTKAEWDAFYPRIESLKQALRDDGHEILSFKTNAVRSDNEKEVFEWDHKQCMECDAMVAVALHPSTGMGMEIILCLTKPKPAFVFATASRDSNPSKMVTGCNLPGFQFQYYEKFEDIPKLFKEAYRSHKSL